ncbi:acetylhydrolase [Actinoplanes sp. NPDC049596]|uniref:alpha/beta hydrolase family protein n=1 Tax=unclassified Actinoplanes TaxID=2626549 RepID=UPI0034324F11
MTTRRTLLTAALTVPMAGAWAAPALAAPARLTLPRPTGPHRIGTMSLLLDRKFMVSVWYPARDIRRHPPAPWMPAASMRALLADNGFDADVAAPLSVGHEGAPATGRWPVILYSHGAGSHRSDTTVIVQELASHGYVVVTVDHSHDSYSQLPDGRVLVPDDISATPWDHAHDLRLVVDWIEDLAAGRRRLPVALGPALDTSRIGVYGWSKGGTAAALLMNSDRRVRAGLSLDAPMLSQPPVTDLYRPFMLMTAENVPGGEESGVAEMWPLLHGWRRQLHVKDASHDSFNDHHWLIPQLTGDAGGFDPAQAVRIQQAYPLAFFELHLRNRRQRLLEAPSPAFTEVEFIG